jgi:hypothetical protein
LLFICQQCARQGWGGGNVVGLTVRPKLVQIPILGCYVKSTTYTIRYNIGLLPCCYSFRAGGPLFKPDCSRVDRRKSTAESWFLYKILPV